MCFGVKYWRAQFSFRCTTYETNGFTFHAKDAAILAKCFRTQVSRPEFEPSRHPLARLRSQFSTFTVNTLSSLVYNFHQNVTKIALKPY